ncbi:Histone-lysine N-methyltransferase 2A [Triplophysa tibetana]|uniref:Histone-lysine N-methyltransferase n=1 Tax=Triplophysa tibetana TaxID=1572043 RepID=A0A5A9MXB7_9TELE|nr:Histone-lysine N-methyltransferase 2A [Triplophysa tibetana]
MPTLSALPWEEREKILSSMGNDDKSSVAGSEEADPPSPPIKPVTRQKTVQEAPPRKGRRSRRCGQCPGCQVPNDCGVCTNCLDKPKFGGRNIKKQCCKVRKCQNLQWMPSKFLQKQAKGKKDKRRNKWSEKKDAHHHVKSQYSEASPKPASSPKEDPPRKKSETPPPVLGEDKYNQTQPTSPSSSYSSPKHSPLSSPSDDSKHSQAPSSSASRKERKQQASPSATSVHASPSSPPAQSQQSLQQQSQVPEKKEGLSNSQTSDPKKSQQQSQPSSTTDTEAKQKKPATRCVQPTKPKPKEKLHTKPDSITLNSQSTPSTGGTTNQKAPYDGVHRIRVDFKEDHDIENVWEMGGLSILTSVPITPRVVCFLCASSGNTEVCCEPFHLFCLEETERPHEEQWENWCCRRCRFCHVCGLKYQKTKICTKCVRCKSCGATKPGKAWDAQWSHDFSLCHDCAKLIAKGNFCSICNKCYDDDDYESKLVKCRKCDCLVHAKCEHLTDDMYELLSNLPESVAYTCIKCTEPHHTEWREVLEKEMQKSMRQVLTALLNSHTSTHLLRYRQAVMKPPELNPETEESLPSRRSPEGPDPPVLTEALPPNDSPLDLESVEKKMDSGCYKSLLEFSDDIVKIIQTAFNSDGGQMENRKANSMIKSFFIRQIERVFPWFGVKESKFWETHKVASNSGLLPNAVLPPSLDHNYAQWQEREEIARAEQPLLMKKIIPAPRPEAPGESESLMIPTPPLPPKRIHDLSHEDIPELPPPPDVGDNRQCALCLNYGDEETNDCGRLLYIGQNEWTHVNCALWSAEVFEDVDGSLKNVYMAVSRGKQLRCENCQKPGATVSCCLTSCTSNYHFMCARHQQCAFLEDKKVYCQRHRALIKGEVVPESGFEVTRRILVDLEGMNLRKKFSNGLEPNNIHMMIGSMTIDCLGMLTELSDCEKLFPVGYQCSRVYWSTLDARKRCVYKCRILMCRSSLIEYIDNISSVTEDNLTVAHCPPPTSDGFTRSVHEMVTVGDPLLSSNLRSVGSRRHSTSSVSPQPHRQKVSSPPQGGTVSGQTGNPFAVSLSSTFKETVTRDMGKEKATSGERSHSREANEINSGPQRRLNFGFTERIDGSKKQSEGDSLKSLQPTSISQVSPPLGTAVLTGHQRGSGSLRTEKGKHATKDTDLPAGATSTSSNSPATLPKDKANPVKEANVTSVPASKDTGKTGLPQPVHSKSGGRKSHDFVSGPAPAAAMKPLWTSGAKVGEEDIKRGVQAGPAMTASHGTSSTKEKHSKAKMNVTRDTTRERKETPQNRNQVLNSNSKSSGVKASQGPTANNSSNKATALSIKTLSGTVGVNTFDQKEGEKPLKSKDRFSLEKKHASAVETIQTKTAVERSIKPPHVHSKSTKQVTPVEKKQREGERLPLKMDPNGTKAVGISHNTNPVTPGTQGPQRRSSRAMVFSPSASSESSESDSHIHPDDSEEHLMNHMCADEGEDHNLEDEGSVDKHHEEDSDGSAGSAKRRYPRRSARARSNMFFGLTPFYGVRSYGAEDIPFYSSGDFSMRKRTGSKRSAEGQVDGADDMSTSSSADSGEDEEGGIGSNKDAYYYNFTRTIINPNSGLPPIAGIDQCLGKGSHIHRFLRDQAKDQDEDSDEVSTATKNLELQQIGQLDGVDDGSESDVSISTSSTSTAATSSTHKSSSKRKGRESRADKLSIDSGKEAENTASAGGGSCNSRKNQKDNCLPLGSVKTQGQDPLDSQLSLSTDLLKSDSDNNNSDDCGNILPSDIMEFVLNTPSMQALGQQTEAPSAEPFSLDQSYGVDVNQRKDMLFEDFPQTLPSAESVESGVNSSIAVEEPYVLPLELPSDLSVLTTRSPTVNNQNHGSLISETSERSILALTTEETGEEKSGKKPRTGTTVSTKSPQDRCGDSQVPEGHITPEHFIPARIDVDHIASPGVAETGSQDPTRTTSTPGLPSSPTVPLQSQKFIPAATISSVPAPITSSAVQATATQIKPGPEKLIVLNQHLQPLYVLQTLPNGLTQKIQIASSGTSVMNTSSPVLTGLSAGLSTSQSIFPAGGKGLVSVSPHQQIHAFTTTAQTGFQSVIPSTTSGLLIGVPSHEAQIGVTEARHRHDHSTGLASASSIMTAPPMLPSVQGKKRISRLHSHKSKKQARSKSQPTLAPSDVCPNMTLINLSPSQIASGIHAQPGLITKTTTPHRKIPNIIKRPKAGVMYLEPTVLPQPMPISTTAQPRMLGHDSSTHLLPCTVPTDITGPISNLLIKANPHNLGLQEQQMVLHSGTSMMSPLTNPVQTSIASSICVFPPNRNISMSVNQQGDKEGSIHLQHALGRVLTDKTVDPSASSTGQVALAPYPVTRELNKGHVLGVLTQSSRTSPIARPLHQLPSFKLPAGGASTPKGKQKAKRPRPSSDKSGGKKLKGLQSDILTVDISAIQASSFTGDSVTMRADSLKQKTIAACDEKPKTAVESPDQRDSGRDSSLDYKPRKGLMFEICSDDGFQIRCESIEEAWKYLTDKVQEARSNARLKALSFDGVNGLKMLGVVHDAVVFLLEQLYGARHCRNYKFRFHKPEEPDDPPINPHGSARAEVYHRRSAVDMFNFLASKHRHSPQYNPQEEDDEEMQLKSARRTTSMNLPLPMRFRHFKKTSSQAVGVYRQSCNVHRSAIHGRGHCCYMFRIDDYEVVDATMHGNAARFINHSCEPNCFSRVVSVDGQKHIVIFAMRKIYTGEELTYDYKFPIEEPGNKLPCNCGAKKCRKFLN